MKTLSEKAGVFNAPSENGGGLFTLASDTTRTGIRSHVVTTTNSSLANALYEQVLNIDIEPEISNRKSSFVVEFIATDADCHEALQLVLGKGGDA